MKFSGQDVIRALRLLDEAGVPAWLDGGWGVDALLGRETRVHRDVDLIVPLDCLGAAELALGEAGFSEDHRVTDIPTRFVLRNCEGLQIDIHPVTFKPDGSAAHIDIDKQGQKYTYVHPAAGLSGVGTINGRVVRCTTAAEQIRQKVRRRYSPWSETRIREHGVSADLEDIGSLLQVYGACEGNRAQATTTSEPQPTGNPVVAAAEQFCLRHVGSLYARHSVLNAQHAELAAQHAKLGAEHTELRAQRVKLDAQLAELVAHLAELGGQHAALREQYAQLSARHAELGVHLKAMHASTSWQLTAPMRWAVQWLGLNWLRLRTQ